MSINGIKIVVGLSSLHIATPSLVSSSRRLESCSKTSGNLPLQKSAWITDQIGRRILECCIVNHKNSMQPGNIIAAKLGQNTDWVKH